jgi:hypothetical protein
MNEEPKRTEGKGPKKSSGDSLRGGGNKKTAGINMHETTTAFKLQTIEHRKDIFIAAMYILAMDRTQDNSEKDKEVHKAVDSQKNFTVTNTGLFSSIK